MEKVDPGNHRPPERGDEAAPVSADAAEPLHLFLSHGSPPRRRQELVNASHGGAPAPDERTRSGRTPLCRRGETDHPRLHRLRRLGVGRRPLRRRSPGFQEADLRDALRPRQRGLCALRKFLYRIALSSEPAIRLTGRKFTAARIALPPLKPRRSTKEKPGFPCVPRDLCGKELLEPYTAPGYAVETRTIQLFRNRNSCRFISTRAPRNVTPSIRRRNLCSAAFSPHNLIAPPEPTTRCHGNPGTCCRMRTPCRAAPAQPAALATAP